MVVVFAVLYIGFALCRKFFGVFGTRITWSSGNWRFYATCVLFLAIGVSLPLIVSFLKIGGLWTLIYLFVFFCAFNWCLRHSLFIFLTIGVLRPPIVIFRFCCVPSLGSNLPFFFCFFAFCLFASSLFRFCLFASSLLIVIMRLPKTISLQVGKNQRRDHA